MKKLNNFLDKAPLLQIYIFGYFVTGLFVASLFYFIPRIESTDQSTLVFSGINCIKMGALSGILFGLMFVLMISLTRKSQKFWEYAKEVEALLEKTETKDELQSIFDNEFQTLRKLCQGGSQIGELQKHYQTLKVKYKYVK